MKSTHEPYLNIHVVHEPVLYPAESTDPLLRRLGAAEAALEAEGWNRPPTFWLIPGGPASTQECIRLPVPAKVWASVDFHPARFADELTELIEARAELPAFWPVSPLGMLMPMAGLMIACEGFGIFGEQARKHTQTRRNTPRRRQVQVKDRPDREEGRLGFVSMVDGRILVVSRMLGGVPGIAEVRPEDLTVDGPSGHPSAIVSGLVKAVQRVYRSVGLA